MVCSAEFKNNVACLYKSGEIFIFHGGMNRGKMDNCNIHSRPKSPAAEEGSIPKFSDQP